MSPEDGLVDPKMPVPRERVLDEREATLSRREDALREREMAILERERAASDWAVSSRVREEEQRGEVERATAIETQNGELRLANEHLVVATIEAQELREAALIARRRQDEFLAMLAHELRNPLGPIRNSVEILARLDDAQPIPRSILDIIRRQIQLMSRLLDDLLDASRVTQGKVALQRRSVDVSEFLNRAVEATSELFKARSQQLTVEHPAVSLFVDGDEVRLVQIFSNLLQNASKYTQAGGSITLKIQRESESVVIRIIDNGMGISAEALPYVFDLFTQDERAMARSQGGLGIGLTVARRMVELHDGTITVSSAGRDQGSEFVVTLPRQEQPRQLGALARVARQPASMPARILLIEDNVDAGEMLATLLRLAGHEVEVALDGPSGLELFDRIDPQVVLCDIGLPGLDGYEVASRIAQRHRTKRPAMIAITGYGSTQDHERSRAAGFDHHMVKPADPVAILRLIDSAMRVESIAMTSGGTGEQSSRH